MSAPLAPDRAALRRLLEESQDRVYNLCFQVLRRREDAEDAAQETLLKVARAIDRIESREHYDRWLTRVALHSALDLRRRSRARRAHELQVPTMNPAPTDDERDALFAALASLEEEERHLVVRHYFDKATLEQLAVERRCAIVSVWKRIERARVRLREALTTAGFAVAIPRLDGFLESAVPAAAPAPLVPAAAILGGTAMTAKSTGLLATGALLLLLLGGVGGWMLKRPAPAPAGPDPRLAETRTLLAEARREVGEWKRKAAEAASRPADFPRAEPEDARPVLAAGGLRDRLAEFRALLFRLDEEARSLPESDRAAVTAFWDRHRALVNTAATELHDEVMKDPAIFIEFLRSVTDLDHLHSFMAVLNPGTKFGEGYGYTPRAYADYPAALRTGLESLVDAGAPAQRRAVLHAIGNMREHPEALQRRIESLVADPDDGVCMEAIGAIEARHDYRLPAKWIPALRDLVNRSGDADVLNLGYQTLGRVATPEMQDQWIERLGAGADGALTRNLLNALGMNRGAMAPDRQGRYVEALKSAGHRAQDELAFRCVLGSALQLAGPDRLAVCESLKGGAPTPAQNESLDRILAMLRDGETRWEKLRGAMER